MVVHLSHQAMYKYVPCHHLHTQCIYYHQSYQIATLDLVYIHIHFNYQVDLIKTRDVYA